MDFCGNGSVKDLLQYTIIPEKPLHWIVTSALEGLNYLHSLTPHPIIHRDIKSANILITDDAEVKIADFGVSEHLTATICARNTLVGTPFWMAPEVVSGSDYDTQADIWSMGITVMEMAEGAPPLSRDYPNPMRAMFKIPFLAPPKLAEPDKWSRKLNEFLEASLVKDASKRPSAKALLSHAWVTSNQKQRRSLLDLIVEVKKERDAEKRNSKVNLVQTTVKPAKRTATSPEKQPPAIAEDAEEWQQTMVYKGETQKPSGTFVEKPDVSSGTFVEKPDVQETFVEKSNVSGTFVEKPDAVTTRKVGLLDRVKKTLSASGEGLNKRQKVRDCGLAKSQEDLRTSSNEKLKSAPIKSADSLNDVLDQPPAVPPKPFKLLSFKFNIHALYAFIITLLLLGAFYYRSQADTCQVNYAKLKQSLPVAKPQNKPSNALCSLFC